MGLVERLETRFDVQEHGSSVRTEVLAGITTFLTMSYIVVVNPSILSAAITIEGVPTAEIVSMLAIVTILSAAVATLIMALYANRPFAQAPGLGLNAFFAFTVVGALGVPWQTALAAVVVEGLLFIVLTAVGAREFIVRVFPAPVKFAVGTGIGLFLTIIGLEAMGIVVDDPATLVTLGAVASDPIAIVSLLGLFGTFIMYARGIPGSIILGILGTTALGWLAVTGGLFAADSGLVAGPATVAYDITPLAGAFLAGFGDIQAFTFALIVFTFFFVDFFDTAGTIVGVGQAGGFLDEEGNLPDVDRPLMADAVGTTIGGALGTSTVTTYIESASGVEAGGRTGLTALTIVALFLISLIFVPLATVIPLYASHIALVVIGILMLRNVADIAWDDITVTIPAGLTILVMPFTYSIAYGIAAGIISYPLVKLAAGRTDELRPAHWVLAVAFVGYFIVQTGGILTG
ncbi:MAG: NCS2 family permease [Haloquadratum sp.]|jgi:Permeases|nr:NCS2 family permease [Haloquadratum sp.]